METKTTSRKSQPTTQDAAAGTAAVLVLPVDEPAGAVLPPAHRWDRKYPARISWAGKRFRVTPGSIADVGE